MAKKTRTEQQEKEIKLLLASNEMYEKTKENIRLRGNDEKVMELVENAQKDIIEKLESIDKDVAKKVASGNRMSQDSSSVSLDFTARDDSSVYDRLNLMESDNVTSMTEVKKEEAQPVDEYAYYDDVASSTSNDFDVSSSDVQYDVVPLPSNGQCYKDKKDRVPVAYLTAYDENLITSPNLYRDGLIIDFLLKHKVIDKSVDIDSLCTGDVDAITLFLRASSYGTDFPIVVKDPETGEKIESVVDLSQLKVKDFNLIGDENGHFSYKLPISGDVVKFRFLTRRDEKALQKLAQREEYGMKANTLKLQIADLMDNIKTDKLLSGKEKQTFADSLSGMDEWIERLTKESKIPYSLTITNRLEMSLVSVNDIEDRAFISKYVRNMGAKDSLMLRRYMLENEPGIDFQITVERPVSLGGGSFKTFLEWDDSIFLNIA